MAPTPEVTLADVNNGGKVDQGEEIVISGISGLFPKSDNVREFMENLYNKVDMVSTKNERWNHASNEMPKHLGFVEGMTKFDAQFFKVHYKQAIYLEQTARKLLESSYCAIFDSGINPVTLKKKKVGVFMGTGSSEAEKTNLFDTLQDGNGFTISGICRTMYANRVSYWLDVKGPSFALDASCASGLMCVQKAYESIKAGECEAAIVGASNYCYHPYVTLNYRRAGYLCMDGKTKSFDKNGDGFVRSDSINVLFIQKAKDAKRIYAEIVLAKGCYSLTSNDEFMPFRDAKYLTNYFKEIYSQADISPDQIEYVEGYAAGMGQADVHELEAIGKVFGNKNTVKVGSVKSNMGHSESASGINSLIKMCLAYQNGIIPANLHYYNPPDHISEVRDGKVQVLQEHCAFKRGYTAINCFSINGYNMHVVLKGHYKKKDPGQYTVNIPYLITASARQEMAMSKFINGLKEQPIDPEQIALLHNIHNTHISGHTYRGYTILDGKFKNEIPTCLTENMEYYSDDSRPVWFLYSGMGSQWAGMGSELMRIPIFAAAIEKCNQVLHPKGINIVKILTDNDKTIFDNILNSFVGIAAVQIGLTDILTEMGIVPDNIIGHSVGELGCAYADGCLTAEEMILSAYSRGLVSVQTPFIKGSMAAVGLGYCSVLPICPSEIEIACHNSSESSTISGPTDVMKKFVTYLKNRQIFAKEVPCSNIAYHSRYIAEAGPRLLKYLNEVITEPKPRSKKWLSTSVPKDKWNDSIAKFSSGEYHTNNLLNPVLFEETSKMIPSNAIVIEIAPHGLLQAIVKRSLSECIHVPLTQRGHVDPVKHFLDAIGKLYTIGLNPKLEVLYPKVQYPVSTETALLSHFIGWEHSEEWVWSQYQEHLRTKAIEREYVISIHDDDYKYLVGHSRDGRYVYPESALLVLVWETFAMSKTIDYRQLSVTFSDVKFSSVAIIHREIPLKFIVMINKGNNHFEVSCQQTTIASGFITENTTENIFHINPKEYKNEELPLSKKDIYKLLYLRGYSYKDKFQSLQSVNTNLDKAFVKMDEWTTFLDGLIQLSALSRDHDGISVPKCIVKLNICLEYHKKHLAMAKRDNCLNASFDRLHKITRCGGVEIVGLVFSDTKKNIAESEYLLTKTFIPHNFAAKMDMDTAVHVILQIVNDNTTQCKIQTIELINNFNQDLSSIIKKVAQYMPDIAIEVTVQTQNTDLDGTITTNNKSLCDSNLIILHDVLKSETIVKNLYALMKKDTFLMILEKNISHDDKYSSLFNIISFMSFGNQNVLLLKKKYTLDENILFIPVVNETTFAWVPLFQKGLEQSKRIVLISENQQYSGVFGYASKIMKVDSKKLSLLIIDDIKAPRFSIDNELYKQQLQKNLNINVFKNGSWGGYYTVSSEISAELSNIGLTCLVPGDIDSLTWVEKELIDCNPNIIKVSYAAITQKDVEIALGDCTVKETKFGKDFSGYDINGQRVMGIALGGSITNVAEVDPDFVWPIPDQWSLEDAATIPVSYVLTYYCLVIQNKLQKKSSVLVTGGAGALGQAVIAVCLAFECNVYATVSDSFKKEFLLQLFPQLDENSVICSNNNSFYDLIRLQSNNSCCNIVISCTNGHTRKSTMKCTSSFGYFIDLSSFDNKQNKTFGMDYLNDDKNYKSMQINDICNIDRKHKKMLHMLIAEGIHSGIVKPLTRVVYSPFDVAKAFRLVSNCRNRGRVLVKMSTHMNFNAKCRFMLKMTCSQIGSYVVVCDNNEIAIELADRLIKNGVKYLVLNIKTTHIDGYLLAKIRSWRKLETTVKLSSEILQTAESCNNLLLESSKLAPVHGIFIVLDIKHKKSEEITEQNQLIDQFQKTSLIVMNLDSTSRNACPELSYFSILMPRPQNNVDSYNSSLIEQICESRHNVGLPALSFQISLLDQFEKPLNNCSTSFAPQTASEILNSLEKILKLKKYYNIMSYNLNKEKETNFFQKISSILGIENIDGVNEDLKISELIVYNTNIKEIKLLINNVYQIDYSYEKVEKLSFAELKQLHKKFVYQNTNFNVGLGAFYTYVDDDECLASDSMVPMKTLANNDAKLSMLLDNISTDEFMFLIPGFEGHYHVFNSTCDTLKVQAVTLQLGPNLITENISEIAIKLFEAIKMKFDLKEKFYIMGYSFGVNVALELATLLESQGLVGVIYCLDSSPDALRAQLEAYIGNLTVNQLQNILLEHMYQLMSGRTSDKLSSELYCAKRWPEKLQTCVDSLKGITKYSNDYRRYIIHSAYQRIKIAQNYKPNLKLQSQIVLIKGISHPNQQKLPDDYNLSQYTNQPVQVFKIESDLVSAPLDCRVPNILNKFIDPQTLKNFHKLNLCESYPTFQNKTIL